MRLAPRPFRLAHFDRRVVHRVRLAQRLGKRTRQMDPAKPREPVGNALNGLHVLGFAHPERRACRFDAVNELVRCNFRSRAG